MEFGWGTKIKRPCALKSKAITHIFCAMEEEIRRYPYDGIMFIDLQTKPELSLRRYHVYWSPNKTRVIPTTVSCLFFSKQNNRYPYDSIMFIHLQKKQQISLRRYHVYWSPNKTRVIPTTVSCLFISKQNNRYPYDGIMFIHLQTKQTNKLKNDILIWTHTCLMLRNCAMIASAFPLNMLVCTAWPAYLYSHRTQAAIADTIRIYWIKTAVTSEYNEFPKLARISGYLPIISDIIARLPFLRPFCDAFIGDPLLGLGPANSVLRTSGIFF